MYAERRECASKCDHVAAGVQGMLPTGQGRVVIAFVLHARQHLQCSYIGFVLKLRTSEARLTRAYNIGHEACSFLPSKAPAHDCPAAEETLSRVRIK